MVKNITPTKARKLVELLVSEETPSIIMWTWSRSKARDSYGYTVCHCLVNGDEVAVCNRGGYDMRGTTLASWINQAYSEELNDHETLDRYYAYRYDGKQGCLEGACGIDSIIEVLRVLSAPNRVVGAYLNDRINDVYYIVPASYSKEL